MHGQATMNYQLANRHQQGLVAEAEQRRQVRQAVGADLARRSIPVAVQRSIGAMLVRTGQRLQNTRQTPTTSHAATTSALLSAR